MNQRPDTCEAITPGGEPATRALTLGRIARRWSVSVERVRQLVESGQLPGAFRIPSAGRYGATIKIPLQCVVEAERKWAVGARNRNAERKPRRGGSSTAPGLKHFPELVNPEPAAECPADAGR